MRTTFYNCKYTDTRAHTRYANALSLEIVNLNISLYTVSYICELFLSIQGNSYNCEEYKSVKYKNEKMEKWY